VITNAMTVDVEDFFQVSAFESYISRDDWDTQQCRVEKNTDRVLSIFEQHGSKATFFTMGWVAEHYPELIRRIVDNGHELAAHSYWHKRASSQSHQEFREDSLRTKSLLEDISGVEVKGYRAPSYSIGRDNLWALDVLQELGYQYSSSIYPIEHDHYGMREAPRFSFYPNGDEGLLEVPVSTVEMRGKRFPCGGGGYFRLFPYALSRWAIQRVNQHDNQPSIFYFHPWEIDPEQPRVEGISSKTRFRHYLNLSRMENRLQRLMADFSWGRMDEIFLDKVQGS